MDKKLIERIKHIETFYEKAPPGYIKEEEERPEDCIPETEGNRAAREFLATAPKKGLWMPLGKEVKVMQCWRCKNYGHRTGDRECPMFISGNVESEKFREMFEDPMYSLLNSKKNEEKEKKLKFLQDLVNASTTDDDSEDEKKKKKKKKRKKEDQKWVEKKVKTKKSKHHKRKRCSESPPKKKKHKK